MLQKTEMHLQLKHCMMKERVIWAKVGTYSYMHMLCTHKYKHKRLAFLNTLKRYY